MTLIIGYECSDGLIVVADGLTVVSNKNGRTAGSEPTQKIHPLRPHPKLVAFAGDNSAFAAVRNKLDELLQRDAASFGKSFKSTINIILNSVKTAIPAGCDELELLFAECDPVSGKPYICAYQYRINSQAWEPHPYCQSSHRINMLFQIGYEPAFAQVGNSIAGWVQSGRAQTIVEMLPGVYKALHLAIENHPGKLGEPSCLYKIDKDGPVNCSADIKKLKNCLAENPTNPDPFLRQCLSPQETIQPALVVPMATYQIPTPRQLKTQLEAQTKIKPTRKRVKKLSPTEQKLQKALVKERYLRLQDIFDKGVILGQGGKNQEALAVFEDILKIIPKSKETLYNKGTTLTNLGRWNEALDAYEAALRIDPKYTQALSNKGVTLDNLGRYPEALDAYEAALRIDPNDAKALSNKGITLSNLGKYPEALDAHEAALRIDPNDAKVLSNKGMALSNLGRWNEALDAFEAALRIDPNEAKALSNKGVALGALGRYPEALDAFETALRINPNEANKFTLVGKGMALGKLSRWDEALNAYEAALRIDPNLKKTLYHKGVALGKLGRYPEALSVLKGIMPEKEAEEIIEKIKKEKDKQS